jgi:hypothetical protein
VANATREEAEVLAKTIARTFERLICDVEEDWDGDFYIRIIAEPGFTPDLAPILAADWQALPWSHPDNRAELTSVTKKIR